MLDDLVNELISIAEEFFGEMVSEWNYHGVEFTGSRPALVYYPEVKGVAIQLSEKSLQDKVMLVFELAHEVCHLLYPTMNPFTFKRQKETVLNEGVSTYFSIVAVRQFGVEKEFMEMLKVQSPKYFKACELVSQLIDSDPESVKKLRLQEPYLNDIELEHFDLAGIEISNDVKESLIQVFDDQ